MQKYELCALLSGSQSEEEINEISKTIISLLENAQAEIKFTYDLGRKKLAYKILGQTHGLYKIWFFEAESNKTQALNEKLRLHKDILRHIITKIEKISIEEKIKNLQEPKKERIEEEKEGQNQKKQYNTPIKKEKIELVEEKTPKAFSSEKQEKIILDEKVSLDQLNEKLDELLESDKI